jgi:hypothetical protein
VDKGGREITRRRMRMKEKDERANAERMIKRKERGTERQK